jgi:hypothetical protein
MVFNSSFNNISVIAWLSVVLVDETGVTGENKTKDLWQVTDKLFFCYYYYFLIYVGFIFFYFFHFLFFIFIFSGFCWFFLLFLLAYFIN